MQLTLRAPKQSLNKAYLKEKVSRRDIELFKKNLKEFLAGTNEKESEEHVKNNVTEFLKATYYQGKNQINTKGRIDLAIYEDKKPVVIFEAKKPNSPDMVSAKNLNAKAMHELILYYLRERIEEINTDIKYLVATNMYEWFVFDASVFDKLFYQNNALTKEYMDWKNGRKSDSSTDFFYSSIASPFLKALKEEIIFTWFDLREVEKVVTNEDPKDDNKLIPLFKLLSPAHLLKQPFANDSNSLDTKFYSELLHIIGLEEKKDGGKKLIQRKEKPDAGSLLENAINILLAEDRLHKLPQDGADFGEKKEDRLFNVALELCITWINRILFLKLLEGQLLNYHSGDPRYRFLDFKTIPNYDELNKLFFQVLARKHDERTGAIRDKFQLVPYLNSSLFDISSLEDDTLRINSLDDSVKLKILNSTVLKDNTKKKGGELPTLQYLFEFLNAYDFTSEGKEEIQEENKGLINASVLGLIFEKINGYKDGSFFTPGFITMYMCRETIRRAVVQKFNEAKGWKNESFDQLYNQIEDVKEANDIINSLKVCDPAVGSGHFLVSGLNEIIAIKSELGVLADRSGKILRGYAVEVINDELITSIDHTEFFEYKPGNRDSQRVQEALFHEKQTIIENCLFGVDINPNSVKICRLRLWIELLKNAYYTEESKYIELETLPNIDINIKQGNSLISRFQLDADLSKALKSIKYSIDDYRGFVNNYKNATGKEEKRGFEALINQIKSDFRTEIAKNDPKVLRKNKLGGELFNLMNQAKVFEPTEKEKKESKKKKEKLESEINKLGAEIKEIKDSAIYKDAFEWRFEFPEILDGEGKFKGFDVVIGNPPYVYRNYDFSKQKLYFAERYTSNEGNFDLYKFFIEKIFSLTNVNGIGSYIVPNTFLSAKTYSRLRRLLIDNLEIIELFDLGLDVFEGVTVENVVFVLRKISAPQNNNVRIRIDRRKERDLNHPTVQYQIDLRNIFNRENAFNIYLDSSSEIFINKLRQSTIPLGNIAYCTVGINTGYIKGELVAKERVDKSYHKVLNGRDIGPYSICWNGDWIKYDKEFVDSFGNLGRSLPPEHIFTSEKILVQRTRRGLSRKLVCAFDDDKYYNLNRLSNIVITDLKYSVKYVIALLNSKVLDYYFNKVFNEYEVKPLHLAQLPIKAISKSKQAPFVKLVNDILTIKKKNGDADIAELESKIDKLVYQLYGLSEDEIKIVEGK